jgi:hypothetical protein
LSIHINGFNPSSAARFLARREKLHRCYLSRPQFINRARERGDYPKIGGRKSR